jgi:actin-like ATPase involved in cell morphogenesis
MEIDLENKKDEQEVKKDEQEIKRIRRKEAIDRFPASGLDVGTGNCVAAISRSNIASFKLERDAFFEIEKSISTMSMLSKMNVSYIECENSKNLLQIVGNEALRFADFFNKECKRPLSHGVISTREKSALSIIKLILKSLLGEPVVEKENCYFSVPAKPIDKDDYNVVYHENVLKSFITSFGFNAVPMNEALAIIFSNLEEEDYSGLAISWGAGMTNVCLAFSGITEQEHQFSLARGGDFIDSCAAEAVGLKSSRITVIKEAGVDLLNPKNREETAIKIYYENLIKYVCEGIDKKLNNSTNIPNFDSPIKIVISGGTSKAINFDKLFEQEIMSRSLPFKIKEIKKAKDQLNAVAEGCLLNAMINSK